MKQRNILAFFLCLAVFLTGFLMKGNIGLYFNLSALMIVVAGTFAATIISFKFERLKIVYQVVKSSFPPNPRMNPKSWIFSSTSASNPG